MGQLLIVVHCLNGFAEGDFGMVIHIGSKQRNQNQAFRLALSLPLLLSSYISIKVSS